MRTTRPLLVLSAVAALLAGACLSTERPIEHSAAPTASAAQSATPQAPRPSATFVAVASVEPAASQGTTDEPEPTAEPSEDGGTAGPGCGTGRAGLFAHTDEVPRTIRFGGATLEFTNVEVSMRNGTYDASDSIPGGIGLTPDEIAVAVGPGDRIVLRAPGSIITAADARVVPWRRVEFDGLASLRGEPSNLAWRLRGDGSATISAPRDFGDYAVEIFPDWTGTCIAGGGVAYGRIKVR